GDEKMLAEMAATQAAGKVVGGHYASPDLGPPFHAYAAGGAADDHEGTQEADAVLRARMGMRAMLRLGSAWYDVERQITAITERGLDPRNFILCTDDCHSETLINEGHMNRVVRHAIDCGCEPLIALQMATINTATHFGLERELGSIAPGRRADFILSSDLVSLPIEVVFARGQKLAEHGQLLTDCPHYEWPEEAKKTVNLAKTIGAADFEIAAPPNLLEAHVKVIGVIENQAPTKALSAKLPVIDGIVEANQGVCQIALVERHRATGRVSNGFVQGFAYQGDMAIASSVAHDSHHIIVVGTNREMMAQAVNRLGEIGGGATIWQDGAEIGQVHLPIAGLMSDRPAAEVAAEAQTILSGMQRCGCTLHNAFMQHSLLALVVIPALRISDLGLVDVDQFALTDLFISE
ncbi:MAG: adenine deaminase C-terminal domain-containing protein, partial [Paracoccaceae bacterium]